MSATNRGAERIEHDNYPTPAWCVRRLLDVAPWNPHNQPTIVEPCAGEGAIVRVLRERYPHHWITAGDVRDCVKAQIQAGASDGAVWDAAKEIPGYSADSQCVMITNPPFLLWHRIASVALPRCRWLALLLRVGAIAHLSQGDDGKGGDITLPTPSLYVLPNRPQFVASSKCVAEYNHIGDRRGCGWRETAPIDAPPFAECPQCGGKVQRSCSDSSEYAWFVWGPQEPRVVVLADTPLSERKASELSRTDVAWSGKGNLWNVVGGGGPGGGHVYGPRRQ